MNKAKCDAGSSHVRLIAALIVVAVIGIGFAVWSRMQPATPNVPEPGGTSLSIEELADLVTQARTAIGLLENEKFAEADQKFVELAKRLPHEPLVIRNLVIGRVLNLESSTEEVSVESLQQSLDALKQVEPESAITYWLAARAYSKMAEKQLGTDSGQSYRALALQQFREAHQRAPDNAAFWYQAYESAIDLEQPEVREEAHRALDAAYRAEPNNLRVTLEWLIQRTLQKDAEVAKVFPAVRQLIQPIAAGVKRRTNTDVLAFIDQLEKSVMDGKWDQARMAATRLRNFMISEEFTRSDQRRVLKSPHEFVLHEFSPIVRNALAAIPATIPPKVEVQYVSAWGDQLPEGVIDGRFADFDLDGSSELIVLKSDFVEVFKLDPQGQMGAKLMSTQVPAGMRQLLVTDLDRDTVFTKGSAKAVAHLPDQQFALYQADPDVFVLGAPGVRVFKNNLADDGQRNFEAVPQNAALESLRDVLAGTLVDIDHDGDVDVLLSVAGQVQIWWNRDNLTFEDATQWSQVPPADLRVESFAVVDWDRDVDLDVLVGGATMPQSGILENLRHGQVRWKPFDADFAALGSAASLATWEADGNASWDLLSAGKNGIQEVLTSTVPAQAVTKSQARSVTETAYRSVLVLDYDNDSFDDVLACGEEDAALFRGQPDGSFSPVAGVLPDPAKRNLSATDIADVDGDGDIDVLGVANQKLILLRNDGGSHNHWISVRVRGEAVDKSGRVNHFGLGSLLELKAGTRSQAHVVQRQTTHFGLGDKAEADVLRVLFPNGIPQSVVQPKADELVNEIMVNKTSCPFVYAWNGERFQFVTDLLWNAPLGLQLADGVIAKDRPWEFLKISGDQLIARDGHYDLQVTAELWEADYFDQIDLIAVDHPADVEIFSNEKVGPAEIAERFVHTVRKRRPLVSARGSNGQDLLSDLARADGKMAIPFGRTYRKGRAEDHHLELDLGKLDSPKRITLFLTGWIQPGDTSLSVAASHNPTFSPGQPPSIFTPDERGEWKQTVPFMGFPGGKPKTIAVDLSNAFRSSDYRLRIATNFELYWDEAFFTVDDEPADINETVLSLVSADLHFRGFSAVTPYDRSQPETYDYNRVRLQPSWPPMQGRFTRYGPVSELLTVTDRKMAILSSGDEMTLRFQAGPEVPAGWKRDFLLHSVGWDKDADLNTVLGQTVEPLPYVGMREYPFVSDSLEEAGEEGEGFGFDRYLREYQTRETSHARFWRNWFEAGSSDP